MIEREQEEILPLFYGIEKEVVDNLERLDFDDMTPQDRTKIKNKLKSAMNAAARDLNFELAARFRDRIREIEVS